MSHVIENSAPQELQQSSWQLFVALTTGAWQPAKFWRKPSFRRKFMLRSMLMPFSTRKLLNVLTAHPASQSLLMRQPRLPCRLHRPYLAANLNRKTALDALCFHYQTLSAALSPAQFAAYMSQTGLRLATLTGRDEACYFIDFVTLVSLDKEGESTLVLRDENQTIIAELTFTLCQVDGRNSLFIGGLQGPKPEVPHSVIQQATKSCNGLFPKRLVMEAACALAQHFNLSTILAVSNEAHVYRSLRYRDKKAQLHADYDSFWESLGGARTPQGYYHLPQTIARKPMEEIAIKKRAEYRRRYTLLDDMTAQILQAL